MTYAVFTGVYRNCEGQSLDEKLNMLNKHGLETHFFSWVDDLSPTDAQMLRGKGVHVHQYDPPFPHVRGIPGRRRQGFLARKAVDHFSGNPRLLKLRWDVKFNEELLENVNKDDKEEINLITPSDDQEQPGVNSDTPTSINPIN